MMGCFNETDNGLQDIYDRLTHKLKLINEKLSVKYGDRGRVESEIAIIEKQKNSVCAALDKIDGAITEIRYIEQMEDE